MANPEHLDILKQGVAVWNQWREDNPEIVPEMSGINMSGASLNEFTLNQVGIRRRRGADLSEVNLMLADLTGADLSETILNDANLRGANLSEANLMLADLNRANLGGANLSEVDLRLADLSATSLLMAFLREVNLSGAKCGSTIFADVDLSTAKGLDTIIHKGPSTLGIDTLFRSKGKIPEKFLRGCGVPEIVITYLPSLTSDPIQFYSCFISYSHADKDFATRLHDRLQGEGIRCWLDEHRLNTGDPLHSTFYEAIRNYDKLLVCCSETALQSWWVENEFNNAVRKEEDLQANVLVPLNLDGYLFTPNCSGWVADRVKQHHVADFTGWKDHDTFEEAIKRVIKALRTDGGNSPPPEPKLKPK